MRVCGGMSVWCRLPYPMDNTIVYFMPGDKIQYFGTQLTSSLHEGHILFSHRELRTGIAGQGQHK